ILRSIKTLTRINSEQAKKFWMELDQKNEEPKPRRL
ncbi:MAG: hypothetical protein JWM11_6955, partial [Planctomycetaceae bacterium]|nr:hypothetical protein [Planctomycetaceae bacterium]